MLPPQMGSGDVLLVLPDENRVATQFSDLDFSFAWYNLLTQEVGPFSIDLTSNIVDASFRGARLIIVPRRTAASFSEEQVEFVMQAVQAGASLLIEMPTPQWAALTAVKRKAQTTAAIKRLTDAPNSPLPTAYRDLLLNIPLDTQVLRIDTLDSETLQRQAMLLELDGAVAHYYRPHGNGHVFVLAFDLGQALTAIQQGRPSDNFVIEASEEGTLSPADLVLNERLRGNVIPYADLLKRHVMASMYRVVPMATLWPFPDAHKSALLLTHESADIGDKFSYMAEYEKAQSVQSSFLIAASNASSEALQSLRKDDFEIAALFVRPPFGEVYQAFGVSAFQPIVKARNLVKQRQYLAQQSKTSITTCKMAGLNWNADYTTTLRQLAKAQCQIDLSYGPAQPNQYGYFFATSMPFLPIERNGLPLPIYILPTMFTDAYGVDALGPEVLEQLIVESQQKYHEALVVNFNADTMMRQPHYRIPELWQTAIATAKSQGTWLTTVNAFMLHYSLRKQAQLKSVYNDNTRLLEVVINLPEYANAFTVALPARTLTGALQSLSLDGNIIDVKLLSITGDLNQILVPLTAGQHNLVAQY